MARAAIARAAVFALVLGASGRGANAQLADAPLTEGSCKAVLDARTADPDGGRTPDGLCPLTCTKWQVDLGTGMPATQYITENSIEQVASAGGFELGFYNDLKVRSTTPTGYEIEMSENVEKSNIPSFLRAMGAVPTCTDEGPQAIAGVYTMTFNDDCSELYMATVKDECKMRQGNSGGGKAIALPITGFSGIGGGGGTSSNETTVAPEVIHQCVAFPEKGAKGVPDIIDWCREVFPKDFKHYVPFGVTKETLYMAASGSLDGILTSMQAGALSDTATNGYGRACVTAEVLDVCSSIFRPCTNATKSYEEIAKPCASHCSTFADDCYIKAKERFAIQTNIDMLELRLAGFSMERLEAGDLIPIHETCSSNQALVKKMWGVSENASAYDDNADTCTTYPGYTFNSRDLGNTDETCNTTDWFSIPKNKEDGLGPALGWPALSSCALPCPMWNFASNRSEEDKARDTAKVIAAVCSVLGLFGAGSVLFTSFFFSKQKLVHPKSNVAIMLFCACMYMFFGPFMTWVLGWEDVTCRNEHYENKFKDGGYCIVSAAMTHFFGMARVVWWTMHAFDFFLTEVRKVKLGKIKWSEPLHHAIGWGIPLAYLIAAVELEKYGFSETGGNLWCGFGSGGTKSTSGAKTDLKLTDLAKNIDQGQENPTCQKWFGSATFWENKIYWQYLVTGPCVLLGGFFTAIVLYDTIRKDLIVARENLEAESKAQLDKAAKEDAEAGMGERTASDGSMGERTASDDSLAREMSSDNLPKISTTPSGRRISVRRLSLSRLNQGEKFDIIGAQRFSFTRSALGVIIKKRENYWAKFAFIFVMWFTQVFDIVLQVLDDARQKANCTFVLNDVIKVLINPGGVEATNQSMSMKELFYVRTALLAGVGIHMFLTAGITSENISLWRNYFKRVKPAETSASTAKEGSPAPAIQAGPQAESNKKDPKAGAVIEGTHTLAVVEA